MVLGQLAEIGVSEKSEITLESNNLGISALHRLKENNFFKKILTLKTRNIVQLIN